MNENDQLISIAKEITGTCLFTFRIVRSLSARYQVLYLTEFHEFFKIQSTQDLVPKVFVLYNCLSTVWCPLHLKDQGLVISAEDHIHAVHSAGCTYVRLVERPG
jgi:hypothetical protein